MKPRKASTLRELSDKELENLIIESEETLVKQRFQHSLKQLTDTTYLNILKRDIARLITIKNERLRAK